MKMCGIYGERESAEHLDFGTSGMDMPENT